MRDLPTGRAGDIASAPHGGPESSACVFDECGCVRLPRPQVSRLGLRPRDTAVLAVYRGIVCLWRDAPVPALIGPDFFGRCDVRVDYDGGVTITCDHLRRAGLSGGGELTVTVWGDELSVS